MWRFFFMWGPLFLFTAWLALVTYLPAELVALASYKLYIGFWRSQFLWRARLSRSAILLLLLASVSVLAEIIVTFFPRRWELPKLPFIADCALLALALVMVWHRWHEWKLTKREAMVPMGIETLIREYGRSAGSDIQRETFLDQLAATIKGALEVERTKCAIEISFMEKDKETGLLYIVFTHPKDGDIDKDLTFREGEGGAGVAYQKEVAVYMPSTRHLYAVSLATEEYKLVGLTFKPGQKESPFRSLLCVPVIRDGRKIGVLNFSSKERSTFFPLDFGIARVAAAFLAIIS